MDTLSSASLNARKPKREVLGLKARALLKLGRTEEALNATNEALSLFRSDALEGRFSLFLLKASLLLKLDLPQDAIGCLIKAISVHRTSPSGWSLLSEAYHLTGNTLLASIADMFSKHIFPKTIFGSSTRPSGIPNLAHITKEIKALGVDTVTATGSKEEREFVIKYMLNQRMTMLPEETREEQRKFNAKVL